MRSRWNRCVETLGIGSTDDVDVHPVCSVLGSFRTARRLHANDKINTLSKPIGMLVRVWRRQHEKGWMSLSGPESHRLVIVAPERADPIEPRTAEHRANSHAGRNDLRHIVQTSCFVRVQVVSDCS